MPPDSRPAVSLRAKVDHDGVVRLEIPLGSAYADHEVQVTITGTPAIGDEHDRYAAWLAGIAGKWHEEVERPNGDGDSPQAPL